MKRYSIEGEKPSTFVPAQEAHQIVEDITAAEAYYAEMVEADLALEDVSVVLENLHAIADTLRDCFYSEESISVTNISGDLTKITGYANQDITPQIAEEDIKDKIREGWEAFKNFINKIIDAVSNFFAKLFNMASAQAQKIVDTNGNDIDFTAEKETLTFDQYKNLKNACEALNEFVNKHVEVRNFMLVSSVKVKGESQTGESGNPYKNIAENLNKDIADFVSKSNNILKAEEGKVTIIDEALKREKKVLSTAGWTASNAVELAKYFLEHKNKATRLGEVMKRLKSFTVQANLIGSAFSMAKIACRAEVSAYTCYAKTLRAFGRQVKCLNGARKTSTNK